MLGYTNFRDMIDGGGAGRSGKRFEGGLLSDALNASGVRPVKYRAQEQESERDKPKGVPAPQYRAQPAQTPQPQVAPNYSVAPYAAPQMMPQVQQPSPQIGLLSSVGAREAGYGIPALMQMPQEPQMRDVRQVSSDPQFQDYMRELQMFNRMYGIY